MRLLARSNPARRCWDCVRWWGRRTFLERSVMHATFRDAQGWWFVLRVQDGHCKARVCVYDNPDLAERLRDYLDNEVRMWQLLERHGLVDQPLGPLGEVTS